MKMKYKYILLLLLIFIGSKNIDAQVLESEVFDSLSNKLGKGDLEQLAQRIYDAFVDYTKNDNYSSSSIKKESSENEKRGLVIADEVTITRKPLIIEIDDEGNTLGIPLSEEKMKTPIDKIEFIEVGYGGKYWAMYGSRAWPCIIIVKFKNKNS